MAASTTAATPSSAGYLNGVATADAEHAAKLAEVAKQVKTRPVGKRLSMRKVSKSHTPHNKAFKRDCHLVDVSELDSVLSIDKDRMVAVCEGRVTIEQLVNAAAGHGLMPAVVPEIHDFTIAGLINGLGIETSSHRFGGFHDTVTAMEVILASGEVRYVDADSDLKLFDCLVGSYGTLGIVTAACVQLIPVRSHVRTRYFHFDTLHSYCEAMKAVVGGKHLFVEGFVFSLSHAVLMLGDLTDAVDFEQGELWNPHKRGAEWIHQHATTVSKATPASRSTAPAGSISPDASVAVEARALGAVSGGADFMLTKDYFFRSERGWLWTLEAFVGVKGVTDTEWGRAMVEDKAKGDYAKMDAVFGFAGGSVNNPNWGPEDLERVFAQQDTIWHVSNLERGCRWVAEHMGVWPLWHCPCFVDRSRGPFTSIPKDKLETKPYARPPTYIVDMGIYGEATAPDYRVRRDMRALQLHMDAPTTFGNVYLSPEEFEECFDLTEYRELRKSLGAEDAFLPIEFKVCVYDASKPVLGKIPMWRLEREGLVRPLLAGVGVTVAAAAAVAILALRHEDGLSGVLHDAVHAATGALSAAREALGV